MERKKRQKYEEEEERNKRKTDGTEKIESALPATVVFCIC